MTSAERERAFLETLDTCRARLRAGEPLEACLADVPPELHEELRAMLPLGARLEGAALDPTPAFIQRLEATLGDAFEEARVARPSRWRRWRGTLRRSSAMRATMVSSVGLLTILGSGFAVVEAAADSLPGEPLYRVKQARESIELWLARSTTAELAVYERQLDRRAAELAHAVRDAHDAAVVDDLERGVAQSVRAIVERALELRAQGDDRAVVRALEELRAMQARVRELATSANPQQLETLARVAIFLRMQELRLLEADTPVRPIDRRPPRLPSRDATPAPDLRDSTDATPTPDATGSTPAPDSRNATATPATDSRDPTDAPLRDGGIAPTDSRSTD